MKKKPEAKDDTNIIKIALFVSLAVNILVLISLISFWVILNNAGTNRYNQSTLRFMLNYTDKQFCTGKGHEKIMNEIASSGNTQEDINKFKENFDSRFCGL